jgi:hypothetical protein
MTPQEYEDTFHYIQRNLEQITAFAVEHAIKEKLSDMLNDYRSEVDADDLFGIDELDYWYAFGERVDLNFISRDLTELRCMAYPVVNGVPNYDEEYEVELNIPADWNK